MELAVSGVTAKSILTAPHYTMRRMTVSGIIDTIIDNAIFWYSFNTADTE